MKKTYSLVLDPELIEIIDRIAQRFDRSRSSVVNILLQVILDELKEDNHGLC